MGRQTENDANEITRERCPGGRGGKRVRGRELQGRGSQVATCLAWLTWPVRTSEEASVAGTEEVQRIKSRRVGPGGNGGRGGGLHGGNPSRTVALSEGGLIPHGTSCTSYCQSWGYSHLLGRGRGCC